MNRNEAAESQRLLAEARDLGIIRFYASTEAGEDVCDHSLIVARYALMLARVLAVQELSFLRDLEMGALLHDIGKVGIPSGILKKRTPLTRLERELVRQHPLLGYRLISRYEFLEGAAKVVLYHHEWYDGTGYPFGLARNSIPLEARIFSLADSLDAMTSDRPYRLGRTLEEARGEIIRYRGRQFDPDVVEAFLSVPAHSWKSVREMAGPDRTAFLVH